MKKIAGLLVLITFAFTCFAQQRTITENEKIQFAMLMNQVQYTTSSIILNKDREILDQEFDFIINQIDKSKLYDSTIKSSYTDLLDTLKELKLTENEKRFVMEQSERERKQAYTKAFTSFGSVFNGGFSPASLITSIAYAGISAGLNIMSAKYDVDNRLQEQLFKLEQKELEKIDDSRIDLFRAYTEIITSYGIPVKYEISETEMKDLIKQLSEKRNDPLELIRILEGKKNKFELFPVFWFQLGAQYQLSGNDSKALECYGRFESLKKNYSYLRTDPYYISVAKNKIEILKKMGIEKNRKQILEYLKIIEENIIPENGSENRIFLASFYYELGQNEKAKDLLRLNLARNEFYSVSSDILALIEYEESKNTNTLNPALLLELSSIECVITPSKENTLRLIVPKKFASGRIAQVKYSEKLYTYPYELENHEFSNIDLDLTFDNKKTAPMDVVILSRSNQVIHIELSTEYIKRNDKVMDLLKEVDMTLADIEPCLINNVIKALEDFSYKPKEDPEYLELVDSHKKRISKQTSKEQKQVFEKEEKEKLEELKVKGRLRAITSKISEVTKELYKQPYFISKVSFDAKRNAFVYSYKSIRYYDDVYTFYKFGIGSKTSVSDEEPASVKGLIKTASALNGADAQYNLSTRYITGNGVEKNAEKAFRYLMISAVNGNSAAQYDLGTIYSDYSSRLAKFFIDSNFVFPGMGVVNSAKNIVTKNSDIEKEVIASYWLKKAVDGGNGSAMFEMAKRYESGLGVEKNTDLAQTYYKKSYYDFGNLDAEKKIKK